MILLSLIGEQPIPNLLPLWQNAGFTATQFACTEATQPAAQSLQAALQNDPHLCKVELLPPLLLHAYDIQKSRRALAAAIGRHLEDGHEVCLNLTGGTKIMSLAALQAAYGSGIRLLYVSTEERQLIYFGSDGAETERAPFNVRISVEQYLRAHGLEVSDNYGFKPGNPNRAEPPPKEGDALEKKVEHLVRQSGWFDDVRRGVFIRRQTRSGAVVNELDVVAVRNARLVVCSCKAGKEVTNDDLYELSSLSRREAAGIYCGKVLAAANPASDALVERARSSGVSLVHGPQVDHIAYYFKLASE